jgi:hypothetical protein
MDEGRGRGVEREKRFELSALCLGSPSEIRKRWRAEGFRCFRCLRETNRAEEDANRWEAA